MDKIMTIINGELVESDTSQIAKILGEKVISVALSSISEFKNEWDLITPDKVCELLNISKPTLEKRVRECCFQKFYLGDRTYFSKQQIQKFIKSNVK